ncbi:MAG: hypothetical protein ILO10_09405 [Kiritimatiellae bacterium]|nr:hypothetical protein [Kiritimatiellia bacterium]
MDEGATMVMAESVASGLIFAEAWWLVFPVVLALGLGVLGVWAWTARGRRPRVSRAVRWGLAVYLLAGALGWGVFLSSEEGPRHPEWFGWEAEETGEEVSP